jgi:hypothetical protein
VYSPPAIAVKTFCDLLGHRTDIQGLQLGLTCARLVLAVGVASDVFICSNTMKRRGNKWKR